MSIINGEIWIKTRKFVFKLFGTGNSSMMYLHTVGEDEKWTILGGGGKFDGYDILKFEHFLLFFWLRRGEGGQKSGFCRLLNIWMAHKWKI